MSLLNQSVWPIKRYCKMNVYTVLTSVILLPNCALLGASAVDLLKRGTSFLQAQASTVSSGVADTHMVAKSDTMERVGT